MSARLMPTTVQNRGRVRWRLRKVIELPSAVRKQTDARMSAVWAMSGDVTSEAPTVGTRNGEKVNAGTSNVREAPACRR